MDIGLVEAFWDLAASKNAAGCGNEHAAPREDPFDVINGL